MDDSRTFSEILSKIPSGQRRDGVHVLVAMWKLQASGSAKLGTSEIAEFLRHHLRTKAPRNVSDALAKLLPLVERVPQPGGKLQWRLTNTGIKCIEELTGLSLSEKPKCTIGLSHLHPRIYAAARELFLNGHHSEAVGRAAKELNRLVRERTGRTRDDGVQMMHQVFSESDNNVHRLVIRPLNEDWERDLQCGLRFMMAGCQSAIANVDKHGDLLFESELEAMECLSLVSHLARQVDRAISVKPTAG